MFQPSPAYIGFRAYQCQGLIYSFRKRHYSFKLNKYDEINEMLHLRLLHVDICIYGK